MTVYVDDMRLRARVGPVTADWSHLLADDTDELLDFADRLGIDAVWLQHPDTHKEHFDVTEPTRLHALRLGATPLAYPRGTAALLARRRAALLGTPAS